MKTNIIPTLLSLLIVLASCNTAETQQALLETPTEVVKKASNKSEPHRYGGWYCPDNFGFVPVDIQNLDEVPAIANRLPTKEELQDNKSLIEVDLEKHPDARALEMDLPRVARIYSNQKEMSELIIVIQAIVVDEDTVVGYRFPNGGNGSAWLSEVEFLSQDEVDGMGSLPFFYSKTTINANKEAIWLALSQTDYFQQLGAKFNEQQFFTTPWVTEARAHLDYTGDNEKANGYVGILFGNLYLHIDYIQDGFHYSEKILMIEDHEKKTTELFVANGPYPEGFENQKMIWEQWVKDLTIKSESR